jgi:hypothetical protein
MRVMSKHCRSTAALLIAAGLLPSTVSFTKLAAAAPPAAAPAAGAPADASQPAADAPKTPAESCGAAYERTQTEKLAGHYVAAAAAALECSQLQCNSAIVQECVRFYSALEQETPTLVFSARKAEGGELTDVRVEMDGKVVAEQITGRPFATDPGPHNFVFIHKKRGLLRLSETARVGDKARVLEVTFADPNAKPGTGKDGAPPEKKPAVPVATWVLGGIGVVGLGAFTYFRLSGVSDYNRMNGDPPEGCTPNCNPDDVDKVRNKFTYSYISLGVGAAALVGAGAFFLANRSSSGNTVQAGITPHSGGAMAAIKTTF